MLNQDSEILNQELNILNQYSENLNQEANIFLLFFKSSQKIRETSFFSSKNTGTERPNKFNYISRWTIVKNRGKKFPRLR
ncbi:Protein CBG25870 [Caenorhabditis briggsae]|uniref:Protein CBG25870 n=1 Tax=Caenorhabditis briggsae TaxID=6238 RepID=B6IIU7_CAEBR|nr:Protein CBG25870 [Caenorhabditis briggsae]CAR99827.1 Protein CBG25870 [Caenorhabditis briggsae]